MKKTAFILAGVSFSLACFGTVACDDGQRSLNLPQSPAAENTVAAPGVEGRQVPDPVALPTAQVEVRQGPVQHEAPVASFAVPGVMQVARCQNWLVATDAAGGLHRWQRNSSEENFVAQPSLQLPGLTTALSCAADSQVLLTIGSMLLRVHLDDGHIAYQSLNAKKPRALALLSDGRLAVLDRSVPTKIIIIDDNGRQQKILVSQTTQSIAASADGGLVALDTRARVISFYDGSGEFLRSFSRAGTGSHDWDAPSFVQLDNDVIAVVDSRRSLVFTYDLQGEPQGRFGENSQGQRELALPSSLAFDADSLWVASRMTGQIKRYIF